MDKEQAKFVLQSFRPDGADAQAPEFAEALALAVADRELGDWLAEERATDAAFAALLSEVEIPDDLRESIVAILAGESLSGELTDFDAGMAGALSSVRAPDGLRDQILAAMEVSAGGKVTPLPKSAPRRVSRWLTSAAVAAAVVLGAFLALKVPSGSDGLVQIHPDGPLTPSVIEQASIRMFEGLRPVSLDYRRDELNVVNEWLSRQALPEPATLPAKLTGAPTVGCKKVLFGERPASLVCVRFDGEVLHLFVFNLEDVEGALPTIDQRDCHGCRKSGWAMATWKDEDRAMFLLGKMSQERLAQVF